MSGAMRWLVAVFGLLLIGGVNGYAHGSWGAFGLTLLAGVVVGLVVALQAGAELTAVDQHYEDELSRARGISHRWQGDSEGWSKRPAHFIQQGNGKHWRWSEDDACWYEMIDEKEDDRG